MRRWLAILLLTLLPIQFSWAAVAAYCGHESLSGATQGAGHIGHHEHQHHGAESPAADKDAGHPKAVGSTDADCGHCHGVGTAIPLRPAALAALRETSRPAPAADLFGPAPAPTPPDRPQWAGLA